MEVTALPIDQTVIAKADIGLIRGFLKALPETIKVDNSDLQQTLDRLDLSEKLMLKTIDSAFSAFLAKCLASLECTDQNKRALFVKDLETIFQSQRTSIFGQNLLDYILGPLLTDLSPGEIWIPGCGDAYEAEWIHKKFPSAACHYFDIDSHAIRQTRQRLEYLNIAGASLWEIDLTKKSALPGSRPDLVLFFNPFVIDHADYKRLVMTLNDKKTTDAKAETYLASLEMSRQSQTMFDNLLDQMDRKNFVSVTMDLAEAHAIHNYFAAKAVPVRCYRNPYAIKNLASQALGKKSPRTEPKIYHYVLTAQTN